MKIKCIQIHLIPVRGEPKVYSMTALSEGREKFSVMCEMMRMQIPLLDRVQKAQHELRP